MAIEKEPKMLEFRSNLAKRCLFFTFTFLLLTTLGCDAFVRKFTRKPKKEDLPQEEMVLVPEEYKGSQMGREELYRQHFLFWKSWQDELINALFQKSSRKRQIDCAEEALKNLTALKGLLNAEQNKKLDIYIGELRELRDLIAQDLYGNSAIAYSQKTERLMRNILRDFSYSKVKNN
jgi:hypothetical protein